MIRNLKTLGLALVAVLAFGAIAASGASAAVEHTFNSELEKTVLTGDNDGLGALNLSVTNKGGTKLTVSCTTASFAGDQTGKTADGITLHPTFGKANTKGEAGSCKLGGIGATVTTTGCNFTFDSDTSANGLGGEDATTSVECEAGKSIKSTAAGCTVSIASESGGKPVNQNLHGISYTNEGAGESRTVKVTSAVKGIHWTASGVFCSLVGLGNGETGTNGEFSGTVSTKGFEYIEGPFVPEGGGDKDAYKEGKQRGIFMTTP